MSKRNITAFLIVVAMMAATIVVLMQSSANAETPDSSPNCVPHEAYEEVINHPAEGDDPEWVQVIWHDSTYCTGPAPAPKISQVKKSSYHCGDHFKTTVILTTITPYMWDQGWKTWVLNPEGATHARPLTVKEPHKVVPCHKVKKHHHKKHHKHRHHKKCHR